MGYPGNQTVNLQNQMSLETRAILPPQFYSANVHEEKNDVW